MSMFKHYKVIFLSAFFCFFFTSCAWKDYEEQTYKPIPDQRSSIELEFVIDTTGSLVKTALIKAVSTWFDNIPAIAESLNITNLRMRYISADGWVSDEEYNIELPKLILQKVLRRSVGEFDSLKNFQQASDNHYSLEDTKMEVSIRQSFSDSIRRIVDRVKSDVIYILQNCKGSSCSDINGSMRRIASCQPGIFRVVVYFTDGSENCTNKILSVPKPISSVSLIIVLVPENANEVGATPTARERGWKQFEIRTSEFHNVVPWARVVPYYENNIAGLFENIIRP